METSAALQRPAGEFFAGGSDAGRAGGGIDAVGTDGRGLVGVVGRIFVRLCAHAAVKSDAAPLKIELNRLEPAGEAARAADRGSCGRDRVLDRDQKALIVVDVSARRAGAAPARSP